MPSIIFSAVYPLQKNIRVHVQWFNEVLSKTYSVNPPMYIYICKTHQVWHVNMPQLDSITVMVYSNKLFEMLCDAFFLMIIGLYMYIVV